MKYINPPIGIFSHSVLFEAWGGERNCGMTYIFDKFTLATRVEFYRLWSDILIFF